MTFGLGILTNDYHWLLQSLLWMMDNMVLTCSNMLIYVDILKETMQGCTASWYIRNNGPITLEITRMLLKTHPIWSRNNSLLPGCSAPHSQTSCCNQVIVACILLIYVTWCFIIPQGCKLRYDLFAHSFRIYWRWWCQFRIERCTKDAIFPKSRWT